MFTRNGLHCTRLGSGIFSLAIIDYLKARTNLIRDRSVYSCVACHRTGHVYSFCRRFPPNRQRKKRLSFQPPIQSTNQQQIPHLQQNPQPPRQTHLVFKPPPIYKPNPSLQPTAVLYQSPQVNNTSFRPIESISYTIPTSNRFTVLETEV